MGPVDRDALFTPPMPGRACGPEIGSSAAVAIQLPVYPFLPGLSVIGDPVMGQRTENGPKLRELAEVTLEFICFEQTTEGNRVVIPS